MEFIINLVVTAALVGLLYLYFNNKIRKALDAQNLLTEVRQEVAALVRDLNQTTERNIILLENKIQDLDRLLASADQKMVLMAKEDGKKQAAQTVYSHLARAKPVPEPPVSPETEAEVIPFPPKAPARTSTRPAETTAPTTPVQPALFAEDSPPPVPAKSLKERVLELAKQGLSANLISNQTGASLAEVDLILSLNRGKW